MKVAVCVTGLVRSKSPHGNVKRYADIHRERFPDADFFYTTWSDQRPKFEKYFGTEQKCYYYDQPEKPYHPYIDVDPKHYLHEYYADRVTWAKQLNKTAWTHHHAKQIINYAWLVRDMPKDYDVLVRIRFDSVISKHNQFDFYIKEAYNKGTVHGFAVTQAHRFNEFYHSDAPKHKYYMLDQGIIHRADMFDPQLTIDAWNEQRLLAAEWGWYQALSHPHGGIHKNHHGFINHDGHVKDMFVLEHT